MRCKAAYIHKVHDHFNFFFNLKMFKGFIPQILRYGSDGITFIDGKGNHRRIGLIPAYQCYIGSVSVVMTGIFFPSFFRICFAI